MWLAVLQVVLLLVVFLIALVVPVWIDFRRWGPRKRKRPGL